MGWVAEPDNIQTGGGGMAGGVRGAWIALGLAGHAADSSGRGLRSRRPSRYAVVTRRLMPIRPIDLRLDREAEGRQRSPGDEAPLALLLVVTILLVLMGYFVQGDYSAARMVVSATGTTLPAAGVTTAATLGPTDTAGTEALHPIRDPSRIVIPAIDVDATIVPVGLLTGGDMETPDWGKAGWYSLGPAPGDVGPAVILAHWDSIHGPDVFYRLKELQPGDEILVYGTEDEPAVFVVGLARATAQDRAAQGPDLATTRRIPLSGLSPVAASSTASGGITSLTSSCTVTWCARDSRRLLCTLRRAYNSARSGSLPCACTERTGRSRASPAFVAAAVEQHGTSGSAGRASSRGAFCIHMRSRTGVRHDDNDFGRCRAEIAKKKMGVAALSVASNSLLVFFKLVVGLLIGSVAVISEAIHSGMDLAASVIAFFAVRASGRKADERHPYGHGKYENVSGVVEALLIFAAAAWIIYEAVHKLLSPQSVEMPVWGVAVMFVSVLMNIVVSRRLFKVGRETDSVALQADAWHLRTDIYTSLGVMLALLVVMIGKLAAPDVDLSWVDPAAAILVALLILKAAVELTWNSARDLLDVSLPQEDVRWIGDFIAEGWPVVQELSQPADPQGGPVPLHRLPPGGRRQHVGGRGTRARRRDSRGHQGPVARDAGAHPHGAV